VRETPWPVRASLVTVSDLDAGFFRLYVLTA
jgi:hypothetical protein